ncbi:MAG: hypothetical protein M1812_005768 [Candelaria pacifica]|nr:MAG: hypothetical protein M1812_005768 [Candelaria pacifica]
MRFSTLPYTTSVLMIIPSLLLHSTLTTQLGPKLVKRPSPDSSSNPSLSDLDSDPSESEFREPLAPICSGAAFGYLPDASLCYTARLAMPMRLDDRDTEFQFGPPGTPNTDYYTPQYFSAGTQQKCVIAISNHPDVNEPDLAVWITIFAAVTAIIQRCVARHGVGGFVPDEGNDGNLAISVFGWDFGSNNPPPTAIGLEAKIKSALKSPEPGSSPPQQDTSGTPPTKKQKTCSAGETGYVANAEGCCAGFVFTKQTFIDAAVQFGVKVGKAIVEVGVCLFPS